MSNIQFILSEIKKEYTEIERLRESPGDIISIYRHNALGKNMIVREQNGNYKVYEALKSLNNLNTVKIYDAVLSDSNDEPVFLVFEEYISGRTLSDMLKKRLFNERETINIISQLCNALYAVNKLNIVHRDIKPENIMIDNRGCLKLIDFGAARLYCPDYLADTEIIGTIGFAAPEQFGLTQTDARVDIYAAGVLMNILLTGEHPSVKIYNGRLKRVIDKCVQTIPEKRYKNALDLKKSL